MPDEQEIQRAGELQRARNNTPRADGGAAASSGQEQSGISLFGGFLFAAVMFLFFDLPMIILDLFWIGFLVNWLIKLVGWLTIYTWLLLNGYSIFDAKNSNANLFFGFMFVDFIPFMPGLSGFVVTFVLREKVKQVAQKTASSVPGGELAAKAL